jgi:capsid protein
MTPPSRSFPRPPRPRAASPAERGAEFAEIQRQLKREAAERRKAASLAADSRPARSPRAARRGSSP